MRTVFLNPYQYPIYLPVTTKGKTCLTRCYPPGQPIVHPLTGTFQQGTINSLCAVAPSKKDKAQFGKCPFTTPDVGGWVTMSVSDFRPSRRGTYRAILSSYYNIESWEQYKAWKRTVAIDLQTKEQVKWMAKIAFKGK
jgi:hypothetical protein